MLYINVCILVLTWVNYFTFIFWTSVFMFLLNPNNLISVIIFSEIVWVILYCLVTILGTINDDLVVTTTTFFFLALAGLEFCLGFIITIFFKNLKKSFELNSSDFKKNTNINRY